MSAKGFRSVFMVASCAGAALGCYLVSLRVASERAALENVETKIVLAQRDIRLLQTEIGTRGRLAQLERWNVKVLALSAPSADQFLDGGFALAKMVTPERKIDLEAPVVLAAAPADAPKPQVEGAPRRQDQDEAGVAPKQMLHVASLKREIRSDVGKAADQPKPGPAAVKPSVEKAAEKSVAKKPLTVAKSPAPKAKPLAVAKAPKPKPAAERKAAASDPLAPLSPATKPKALASAASNDTGKDSGSKQ